MEKSLLEKALKNPELEILFNQDNRIGESVECSLNDLMSFGWFKKITDLLEYDIVENVIKRE